MSELYTNPTNAGKQAFKDGKTITSCPIDRRTHANHYELWRCAWLAESTKCKGIEIETVYSGCNGGKDCPVCHGEAIKDMDSETYLKGF